ncbi:MAG TPA: isochorismatase family cysteine hydrolase [Candidatus Izemoplasmatales bacterium]|nr:isochorismatase family cysteine hydrolase [Candidatus Izemoplasmatales bacterium]
MKKCLIVVDYQNDFIDGALGFEGGRSIKDNIIKKIQEFRQSQSDIIFTMDTHSKDYLKTEEGQQLPVIHCVKGTKGHKIQADVRALMEDQDMIFEKETFPSIDLGIYLKDKGYDYVELCGLVSNICVISNAVIAKSALANAHIVVDASASNSADQDLHKKSLDVMKGLHIEVINDDEN